MHKTASKGNISVAKATADLLIRGFEVLTPVCSTSPFDLVIYKKGVFRRVQVKYISAVNGVLQVTSFRKSIWNGKVRKVKNVEIDIICVFNPETNLCYYLTASQTPISIRISPPKNNYKTGLHFASDYTLLV
jgi:hypothetical protein